MMIFDMLGGLINLCFQSGVVDAVANSSSGTSSPPAEVTEIPKYPPKSGNLKGKLLKKLADDNFKKNILQLKNGSICEFGCHRYKVEYATNTVNDYPAENPKLVATEQEVGWCAKMGQFFCDLYDGTDSSKRLAKINTNLLEPKQQHYKVEIDDALLCPGDQPTWGNEYSLPEEKNKDDYSGPYKISRSAVNGKPRKNNEFYVNTTMLNFLKEQQVEKAQLTLIAPSGWDADELKQLLDILKLNVDGIENSSGQKIMGSVTKPAKQVVAHNDAPAMTEIKIVSGRTRGADDKYTLAAADFDTPIKFVTISDC